MTPSDADISQLRVPTEVDKRVRVARRRIASLGFFISCIVAAIGLQFAPTNASLDAILPTDPIGVIAPEISLPTLATERELSLSEYVGVPIVVNFWASWCTACKDEAALLGDAHRKWRDQGVVFLGVDASDTSEAAKEFMALYNFNYDSFFDQTGAVGPAWGLSGYPATFFIDRQGRITGKHIGAIDPSTLEKYIAAITQ